MKRKRLLKLGLIIGGVLLIVACVGWWYLRSFTMTPVAHLRNVVQLESAGTNSMNVQPLGWSLAILGRDDEVRSMDFMPQFERSKIKVDRDALNLNVSLWREAIPEIASKHRIVMIMEDHFCSKHREMITAMLPIFRENEFVTYAAEGIGRTTPVLGAEDFPSNQTGFYTADPQFANLIRRAISLDFEVVGYDFGTSSHEAREAYAADRLSGLFEIRPDSRMVIHAGFAHVFKNETDLGRRWLASLLWEKTGVEPFTIWQWSEMHDGQEYRAVADAISNSQDFNEPILLMPPPSTNSGLVDVPDVDAILVHPPDSSIAPASRTVLFPANMHRVVGRWQTEEWPVVVLAKSDVEPDDSVPLDQVLLREGEHDFVLWVPKGAGYDLSVINQHGSIDVKTSNKDGIVQVGRHLIQ
jgi:hypothetical protein